MTEYIFPVKHSIAAVSCSARCWLVVSSCCRAAVSQVRCLPLLHLAKPAAPHGLRLMAPAQSCLETC